MLVKKDPAFIQSYLEDSSNLEGGYAERVVIPETINEVSSFLKEANTGKTPVTVSGAGTGQAAGRIPFGGTLLSTEKFNSIKKIENVKNGPYAVSEAGVLIQDLKAECDKKGLFYTYDPTEQTAFVGGTVATNASGARSFRYGPTRKHVRALTLVLADGTVFYLKRGDFRAKGRRLEFEAGKNNYKINLPTYKMPRTKNSAGYYAEDNMDLVDLFVGQEGTLSVIAEVEFALLEKPRDLLTCFVFFREEEKICDFINEARDAGPNFLEYFDARSLELLKQKSAHVKKDALCAVFFEYEIRQGEDKALEKWEKILTKYGVSLDETWVAVNEKTRRAFMEKRHFMGEQMDEMAKRSGFPKVHTDLAVPQDKLCDMLRFYKSSLEKSALRYFVFGHIGDAHLHVNMLPFSEKEYDKARKLELEFVKKSIALGGTVSAEHGIGKTKKEFLKLLYGEKGIREMITVKKALDPNLILGRGNIFDI